MSEAIAEQANRDIKRWYIQPGIRQGWEGDLRAVATTPRNLPRLTSSALHTSSIRPAFNPKPGVDSLFKMYSYENLKPATRYRGALWSESQDTGDYARVMAALDNFSSLEAALTPASPDDGQLEGFCFASQPSMLSQRLTPGTPGRTPTGMSVSAAPACSRFACMQNT